jgi:MarR-like DNA-binding transcriptional regulator SgrR of sgrS sRNA
VYRLSARSRALALLLACACAAHAHTRPHYGGTLRVETLADPWQPADGIARRLVFDALTRIDSSGTVQPQLAIRWTAQNGAHRWQFWLRPGVRFHDGLPLTADTVQQSLEHACTQCPWTSMRVAGDSIVFTTASPDPVLPAELSRTLYAIARQDASGNPIGTSAFRFVSNTNNIVSLAAVDDGWQGRPFADAIEIAGRRTVRTQWLDLAAGHADIVDVPIESLRQAQQEHFNLLQSGDCDLLLLSLAHTGALADDAQREALGLAVDRAVLSNVIFQKQGEITASLLPNALTGYAFLFPTARDLSRAQELRGAATATPLTLRVDDTNAAVQLAAERIALNLRDAGFHVQVATHTASSDASTADLTLRRIHLDAGDAQAALAQMLGYFNQSLTEESADPATLYREELNFARTHQAVPLLYLPRAYGVGARVQGLHLSPDGIPLLADVSLPPDSTRDSR